jgi:hypothetical protein
MEDVALRFVTEAQPGGAEEAFPVAGGFEDVVHGTSELEDHAAIDLHKNLVHAATSLVSWSRCLSKTKYYPIQNLARGQGLGELFSIFFRRPLGRGLIEGGSAR